MSQTIDGGTIVIDRAIHLIEPNRRKITVDLKQEKLFADGIEITGIRQFALDCEPGHKRLTAKRFKIDESGKPMAEYGAIFEQDLEFIDDQFEVIA